MARRRRVERIGHRGAPAELPENSLAGFVRAFERGADAVELDIHATADGEIVVHHDPSLSRRSNAHASQAIAALQLAQLREVELAPGIGVPTLREVLAAAPAGKRVYVELKGLHVVPFTAALLAHAPCECAVHSFDHDEVARMQLVAPNVPRGILFDSAPRDVVGDMHHTGARDVWPKWTLINRSLVDTVHNAGGRVIAWTVNTRDAIDRLTLMGVDGICTDDVRLLG